MANGLMRFNPYTGIAPLDPFSSIDDFLGDLTSLPFRLGMAAAPRGGAAPPIRLDVTEDDQNYLVKADIPGVNKDDIKVAIDGNQVSVSAEMKEEKEVSDVGLLCRERRYGQQYRSFTLPQEVDDTQAQARYENGVLHLTLPKKAGTSRKQLAIQ